MPDNLHTGYLEHFLSQLIPKEDPLWMHTQTALETLREQPFNEITAAKWGKAHLHTWLSWKKEPGKPFGQAIDAGYLSINASIASSFIAWFSGTFQLS